MGSGGWGDDLNLETGFVGALLMESGIVGVLVDVTLCLRTGS